jgi:hypothetical protein
VYKLAVQYSIPVSSLETTTKPGSSFNGLVSAVREDEFEITLPKIPPEVAIGVIKRGPDVPNWGIKSNARVAVVKRHDRPGNATIFELRRLPRK